MKFLQPRWQRIWEGVRGEPGGLSPRCSPAERGGGGWSRGWGLSGGGGRLQRSGSTEQRCPLKGKMAGKESTFSLTWGVKVLRLPAFLAPIARDGRSDFELIGGRRLNAQNCRGFLLFTAAPSYTALACF